MLAELTYHAPAFSALLLLISGVLVGYALSYPFRNAQESDSDRLQVLHQQNTELEAELRDQRSLGAQMEQALSDHKMEADSLEFSSQSMSSQLHEHQAEQQHLQSALDAMRLRRDQLQDELENERQSKVDLVSSLSSTQSKIMSSSDELLAARETISQLKAEGTEWKSKADEQATMTARLEAERENSRREATEWKEKGEALQSEAETLRRQVADMSEGSAQVGSLTKQLRERDKELAQVRARYAEIQSSQAVLEERIHALDADLERERSRVRNSDTDQQLELSELRESKEELGAQYATSTETIAQLREAVETLMLRAQEREDERDYALTQLDNEQQQRMALDNMLRHKDNQLKKSGQSESALQEAMQTVTHLQTSLDQASARLHRTAAERDDAVQTLSEIQAAHSAATEDISSHQRALEAIERQRDEAESQLAVEREKYQQLLNEHEYHSQLGNQAQQQLSQIESQLRQSEIERNEAESRLTEDATQVESLREELLKQQQVTDEVRQQREEILEQLRSVQHRAEQFDQVKAEFDEHQQAAEIMRADFDATLDELKAARQQADQASKLEHDVDQYRLATEEMRRIQQDAIDELREEQAKSQQLQAQLSDKLTYTEEADQQLKSLKPLKFELTAMQNRLQSTVEQLQRIRQERDDALRVKASTEQTVADLRTQLRVRVDTPATAPAQVENEERWVAVKQELEATRASLSEAKAHLTTTRAQLNQREGLMVTLADQKASESDRLRVEVDATREELSRQGSMIEQLRDQLADRTETIAHLKQDRDVILRQLRSPAANESSPHFAVTAGNAEAAEHHETRGMIYTTAPEQVDDLKRISGIAEKLEARLNEFGIYTYQQIMNWDPRAVEEFCRLLTFRDRIERDDWIGQSRQLNEEKYGQRKRSA